MLFLHTLLLAAAGLLRLSPTSILSSLLQSAAAQAPRVRDEGRPMSIASLLDI